MHNPWLIAAGVLNIIAALLHAGCIIGGPDWYRFFGAGEHMAQMAQAGLWRPIIITLGITGIILGWAAYAFSGAGIIPRLPLMRTALVLITAVYLLRAAALPFMHSIRPDLTSTFMIWSSAIVFIYGIVHVIGLVKGWAIMAPR